MSFKSELERIEFIKKKLETEIKWTIRGILVIYRYQTNEEKSRHETIEDNGIGFNGVDARILTSYAKQILEWERKDPATRFQYGLSPKQYEIARRKMGKYAKQICRVEKGKLDQVYPIVI